MKKCIVILTTLLCNLLTSSESTGVVSEEATRVAKFEVRHRPLCYLDGKNNAIAHKFQFDFLFNGEEYYTSPIMGEDIRTIGLDELYIFDKNINPALRQQITDFFEDKNLTSFSITHTQIGVAARIN